MEEQTINWLRQTCGPALTIYAEGVCWEDLEACFKNRPDAEELWWQTWHTYFGAEWVLFPEAVVAEAFAEFEKKRVVYRPGPDDGKVLPFRPPRRTKPKLKRKP